MPPLEPTPNFETLQLPDRDLHLAAGIFDGVHLGHQAVIEAAIHSARCRRGVTAVLTFTPHPTRVLSPDKPTLLLMPGALKERMLRALGVDYVIWKEFTPEFAALAAEEFLPCLKKRLPSLRAVYVGENFHFGRGRQGDALFLAAAGQKLGLSVFSVERIKCNGVPISSSRIRSELTAGRLDQVNALLGYTYCSEGTVQSGRGLGRKLGFPTLNFDWRPELPPRFGVYAVKVCPLEGRGRRPKLGGVANYGVRPTVASQTEPVLEVHLLHDAGFKTGDRLAVEWHHFLRPEIKFATVDELVKQIALDKEQAAALLK